MPQNTIWDLSNQNHYASRSIQAAYRGYACRKILWSANGVLTQARALLIQRVYRGHRGRQLAAKIYFALVTTMSMRLQRFYRCWKARRTYRIMRSMYLNKAAYTIQHFYRTINTRRMFEQMQERIRSKMAIRMQKVVKGCLVRRRVRELKKQIATTAIAIRKVIRADLHTSSQGIRMTLATIPASSFAYPQLLHLTLSHLVGTHRNDFSIALGALACRQFNTLQGYFLYATSLLCSWTCYGPAKLIREDYLAEAVGILLYLRSYQHGLSADYQHTEALDTISAYYSYSDIVEACYFRNTFDITGTSTINLSNLACYLHASKYIQLGQGYFGTRLPNGKLKLQSRQKQLLQRAKEKSSVTSFTSVQLQLQVSEHLFENEHELIVKQRRAFRELLLPEQSQATTAPPKRILHQSVSLAPAATTKNPILLRGISEGADAPENVVVTADITVSRCGDMVLLLANIAPPRESITDTRDKWNTSTLITPFVLTVAETKQIYEFAVPYFVTALRKTELHVRKMGKWKLIGEFILQTCRIVSIGSHMNSSHKLLYHPTGRITLPYIEYRRRERNDLAMEEYATKLLQRAFRGFSGRSLWRRLRARGREEKRQKDLKKERLAARALVKMRRHAHAATIQASIKGYLTRKLLRMQHRAATIIQSQARVKIARLFMARERFRRLDGPEVVEMYRKTTAISSIPLVLVVYRSGSSFKIVGNDLLANKEYVGFVHEMEIRELLEVYNRKIKGTTRQELSKQIQLWQHEKVTRLLVENLSLINQITTANTENGAGRKVYNMTFVCMKNSHGRGIQDTKTLRRVLPDAEAFVPALPPPKTNKHQLKELLRIQKRIHATEED